MQNRESATRVRSRKRNQIEQVEDEIMDLKRKNEELMLYNASLTAENNLLKQQIAFLQKVVIKSSKQPDSFVIEGTETQYLLPMKNNKINPENEPEMRIRLNQSSPTKHFAILGVFTVLIFIFSSSLQEPGASEPNGINFSDQFRNQFDRSLKSLNGKIGNLENEELNAEKFLGQTFEFLIGQYNTLRSLIYFVKYVVLFVYVVYVLWIVYNFVIKKYVKLKIKKI